MKETVLWWSAFIPWLLLTWALQRIPGLRGWCGVIVAAGLAAAVVFIPWISHPLPWWSASLSADFSIVMASLLVIAIVQRAAGKKFFTKQEWKAAWIFGACAAVALYPSTFGVGPQNFDAYTLGWPWLFWQASAGLFGVTAIIAAFLTWRGNRFGYLLLLATAAYLGQLQESDNFWDSIIDPLYATVSLLATLWILSRCLLRKLRERS